jgi:hypothetical protein
MCSDIIFSQKVFGRFTPLLMNIVELLVKLGMSLILGSPLEELLLGEL